MVVSAGTHDNDEPDVIADPYPVSHVLMNAFLVASLCSICSSSIYGFLSLNYHAVLWRGQFWRVFTAPLISDSIALSVFVIYFLHRAKTLEDTLGSRKYGVILCIMYLVIVMLNVIAVFFDFQSTLLALCTSPCWMLGSLYVYYHDVPRGLHYQLLYEPEDIDPNTGLLLPQSPPQPKDNVPKLDLALLSSYVHGIDVVDTIKQLSVYSAKSHIYLLSIGLFLWQPRHIFSVLVGAIVARGVVGHPSLRHLQLLQPRIGSSYTKKEMDSKLIISSISRNTKLTTASMIDIGYLLRCFLVGVGVRVDDTHFASNAVNFAYNVFGDQVFE